MRGPVRPGPLEPWRKRVKRRLVETAKFYFFDVGIANQLHPESRLIAEGSNRFGVAFEHFLINEVRAFLSYRGLDVPLSYWRTTEDGIEIMPWREFCAELWAGRVVPTIPSY
jgi:predicted AAA+ superfamily ATPase